MKLKVLYVKSLPTYFKQCAEANVLHFRFENEEAFINKEKNTSLRKQYLNFAKMQICEEIKNANIVARPEPVKVNGDFFVAFKSNLDKRMLDVLVRNLLLELNEYTEGLLDFYYSVQELMLMEEGKEPSIIGSMRMGEKFLNSDDAKMQKLDTEGKKSRTKYFSSFEEFANEKEKVGFDYYI